MPESERELLKVFGANLRHIRLEKKLSLRKLSALCSIDHSDLSRMETGQINLTIITVAELARALDVSISKLMKGVE
jgi:transcriptional regulator with XRE-family HTH domain